MKKITALSILIAYAFTALGLTIKSPNGSLMVDINCTNGQLIYSAKLDGNTILHNSCIGLVADFGNLSSGLTLNKVTESNVASSYKLKFAKAMDVDYEANTMILSVSNSENYKMDVELRVANNSIAYRYIIPTQYNGQCKARIISETSTFDFPDNTTTFLTPLSLPNKGWKETYPSYEESYTSDAPLNVKSKYELGYTFPCLFKVGNSGWVLVSEAGIASNYCGCHLSDYSKGVGYSVAFPPHDENNGCGDSEPAIGLPGSTPWRTIAIGSTLAPIVETTVQFDYLKPLYEPKANYKAGRYTWSWIIWQDASCNYTDQMAFIDMSAHMGYEYVLIDANWDVEIGRNKITELSHYAQTKGVSLILWYNSNGIANNPPQTPRNIMGSAITRKHEMEWLRKVGIKGIKVDFFGGDKQQVMELYEDILSDANDYGIAVMFHGCTIPRGWERLYPNYISSEACLASENVYFTEEHAKSEAFELSLHPFIRNAIGSFDWGGVMLNRYMSRDNKSHHQRYTTDAFELATTITNQTSINAVAIMPNNLSDMKPFVKNFLTTLPTEWSETRYVDGYPGRYAVIARKTVKGNWYVGGINAEKKPLTLEIKLPMLAGATLQCITDSSKTKNSSISEPIHRIVKVSDDGTLKITMATNGGVLLYPLTTKNGYSPDGWRGDNYEAKDGSLSTFQVPNEYPFMEGNPSMNVLVDNVANVGLFNDNNYWRGNVQFGSFDIAATHKPEITVITDFDFEKVDLLPHSAKVSNIKIDERKITFNIDMPDQYLTLVFDDNYKGDVLHLFCNNKLTAPKLSKNYDARKHYDAATKTYYFGPGYHDLSKIGFKNNTIILSGNQKAYLSSGAVVNGRVHITGATNGVDNALVYGNGMLVNDKATDVNSLLVDHTNGGRVKNILIHTHRKHCWQTIFSNCQNVNVENMKVVGTHYASTDGIDIIACQNCNFENIFVRAADDCIALKGLGNNKPAESAPQKHLSFNRMQLWNDCNNAFGIGAETHASEMSHIKLTNSEILFSYDDPEFHEHLDERSAMNICCLHGTYFHNILFDNIYVNRCERLIGLGFKSSFWFGSLAGDQSTDGCIYDITFRNITCPNKSNSNIANKIWLYGWYRPGTPLKTVRDITFDNVNIYGKRLASEYDYNIVTNNKAVSQHLVYDLHFY